MRDAAKEIMEAGERVEDMDDMATADITHDKNVPESWKVNHTRTEGWKVQVQAHKTDNDISMFDLQKRDKQEIAKELEMRDAAKYY